MHHRWGRWFLMVAAIAAAAGACIWTLQLERRVRTARQTAVTAASHAAGARTALAEVRRALAAMASPGQAAVGWSRRAAAGIEDARSQVTALAAIAPAAPPAPAGVARRSAGDVLDRLGEAERRLRDHAVGGKPLMAADVAFGEAIPHVDDLERQVTDAQSAVSSTAENEVAALRDRQVMALAGALGSLLVAALALTPLPRARPFDAPAAAADVPPPGMASYIDVPLDPDASVVLPAPPPDAPHVDLLALAAVCGELAQLAHAEALPPVLERVAAVLGAQGVMVWLGDAERRHLHAVAAAGYDARLLDRLGPVDVADDNPTARAFTTGQPILAAAGAARPATVSVPIAGASGVCGVLSAELIRGDAAAAGASAAAARVVAAQLAALVAPPDVAAAVEAQGVAENRGTPRRRTLERRRHRHRPLVAHDGELHLAAVIRPANLVHQLARVPDGRAVHPGDDIAGLQAGLLRRGVGGDARHQHPTALHAEVLRQLIGERLDLHPESAARPRRHRRQVVEAEVERRAAPAEAALDLGPQPRLVDLEVPGHRRRFRRDVHALARAVAGDRHLHRAPLGRFLHQTGELARTAHAFTVELDDQIAFPDAGLVGRAVVVDFVDPYAGGAGVGRVAHRDADLTAPAVEPDRAPSGAVGPDEHHVAAALGPIVLS